MYGTKTIDPETAIKYETFSCHAMRCCLAVVVSSWLLCISRFLSSGDWLLASWPHFVWNANTVLPEKSAKLKHWALKGTADNVESKHWFTPRHTHARKRTHRPDSGNLDRYQNLNTIQTNRGRERFQRIRQVSALLRCIRGPVKFSLYVCEPDGPLPSWTFPSVSVKLVCFRS